MAFDRNRHRRSARARAARFASIVGVSSQCVTIGTGASRKMPSSVSGLSTSMLPVDAPMKILMPQRAARIQAADRLEIVVGRAKIEARSSRSDSVAQARVLVGQRRVVGRGRPRVRHLEEAGDAAGGSGARLGEEIALVLEPGFAEVHLVVDHAWQQQAAARRRTRVRRRARRVRRRDGVDAPGARARRPGSGVPR